MAIAIDVPFKINEKKKKNVRLRSLKPNINGKELGRIFKLLVTNMFISCRGVKSY